MVSNADCLSTCEQLVGKVSDNRESDIADYGTVRTSNMVVFSLTLVRHGETSFNRKNIIQGQTDVPLSNVGVKQAQLVATRLQNDRFTHLFTSDLSRASQTAQIIADGNKVCRCDLQQDKRLRERKFGAAEGKCSKDLMAAAKKAKMKVPDYTPPGAESLHQMRERVESFFTDLCEMCFNFPEDEDTNYSPARIKRRHGGSLGRKSGPSKRLQISRRSQSFCGSGNIQNIINEVNLHPEYDDDDLNMNESLTSFGPDQNSFSLHCGHTQLPGDYPYQEAYHSSSEESSSIIDLQSGQSHSDSLSECSSQSGSEDIYSGQHQVKCHDVVRVDLQSQRPCEGNSSVVFQIPDSTGSGGDRGSLGRPPGCPNVSLSPVTQQRLPSISSMSSGRNSSFDDLDGIPLITAEVLLVSHGGYIKEILRHFVEDLDCKVPGVKSHILRVCPNCSISKFIVSLDECTGKPSVTCISLHDKDHLACLSQPEAEGTL